MENQGYGKHGSEWRTSFNVLYLISRGSGACVLPFLKWNMGAQGIGFSGLLAILVMWVYGALARCPDIVVFFWLWLMAVAIQRVRTMQLCWGGAVIHSRYQGDWITMYLPFVKKTATAAFLALGICFALGMTLAQATQPFNTPSFVTSSFGTPSFGTAPFGAPSLGTPSFGAAAPLYGGRSFGVFLMLCAVGQGIAEIIDRQALANRLTAMKDAEIEQRFMADVHSGNRVDY